jgi:hypothetical protein
MISGEKERRGESELKCCRGGDCSLHDDVQFRRSDHCIKFLSGPHLYDCRSIFTRAAANAGQLFRVHGASCGRGALKEPPVLAFCGGGGYMHGDAIGQGAMEDRRSLERCSRTGRFGSKIGIGAAF